MKIKTTFSGLSKASISMASALLITGITQAATIITPTSATANYEYGGADGAASNLIDASALNGSNQLTPRAFGSNYLSSDLVGTWENWVIVDLGANYDLAGINVWNYHDSDTVNNLGGRQTKGGSLWVAGSGATLPTAGTPAGVDVGGSTLSDVNGNNPFNVGNGWTSVWSGDLAFTARDGAAHDADLVVDATGNNNVRYVGFKIDDRWGHYNWDHSGDSLGNHVEDGAYPTDFTDFAVGLGHIQVTQVPEPSSTALVGLGGLALILRRRK